MPLKTLAKPWQDSAEAAAPSLTLSMSSSLQVQTCVSPAELLCCRLPKQDLIQAANQGCPYLTLGEDLHRND